MKIELKNWLLTLAFSVMALAPMVLASSPDEGDGNVRKADREKLLELNAELAKSQIVDRDPTFISRIALENFRVLAPGGLFENKEQVIAGLSAWDATEVTLTGTEVLFHGDIAIVMGRMDIDGVMRPVGRWGPLKYISTWIKEEGNWRLLSRALTPCIDKLIELNRC